MEQKSQLAFFVIKKQLFFVSQNVWFVSCSSMYCKSNESNELFLKFIYFEYCIFPSVFWLGCTKVLDLFLMFFPRVVCFCPLILVVFSRLIK